MYKRLSEDLSSYKFYYNRIFYKSSLLLIEEEAPQFSGLTKEELLKYADDPFWVNLRWGMFVLFWAMWLCMLAGAITIIIRAPKCAAPEPKNWFEEGPLVDVEEMSSGDVTPELPLLQSFKVQGIFIDVPTYDILDDPPTVKENFQAFVKKAKEFGIKVIVDLIPNYVSLDHPWFLGSENKTEPFTDYFVWAEGKEFDESGKRKPPNNWVSTLDQSAWSWSEKRGAHYLHQYGETQPDLNFNNQRVVEQFNNVLKAWMAAGAAGVRLHKTRQLLVNSSLADESPATGRGSAPESDHTHYAYWRHRHTSDQPRLDSLLATWSDIVDQAGEAPGTGTTVFTIAEEGGRPELFLLERNLTSLRPVQSAPLQVGEDVAAAAAEINARLGRWPAMQLKSVPEAEPELASLALLLPAAPILNLHQLEKEGNLTSTSESVSHVSQLREDASIQHGHTAVAAVPPRDTSTAALLACARWKSGHTGYLAVFNPSAEELRANLTSLTSVPDTVTLHHMSHAVKLYTNYTNNYAESSDNVLVPPRSSVVLSYVPKTSSEN
ncbi:neutral and basic amino acid transport protein rBAT isoform X2 [Trichoplusia ni]|uniref:alpha-glucosidase n=1 Tax=Trichoplusia ni TaxID=7111 RepID=A0A7E5VBU7_TRINI|nr:neutral and basic amino acid transport protein rBAT isoform X2 [Trichoplusia ni]